jgi:putative photosynthetic complex assembly protein 2
MTQPLTAGAVPVPLPTLVARDWRFVPRPVRRAGALVVGFWWMSTGLIFALQRNALTRGIAFGLFTAVALAAIAIIRRTRDDRSPRAVAGAFLAGGALWAWLTNALFGGWVVGPPGIRATEAGPSIGLALEAVHATLYSEIAGVALLLVTGWLVRGAANRMSFAAMLVLWGSQQLAKLNIFVGVPNPGTRFLPDRLRFLGDFFGPEEPSLFLGVSIAVLAALALRFGRRAAQATEPADRFGLGVLAVLLALAAVEHLVLGIRTDLPLWDVFLRLRGH